TRPNLPITLSVALSHQGRGDPGRPSDAVQGGNAEGKALNPYAAFEGDGDHLVVPAGLTADDDPLAKLLMPHVLAHIEGLRVVSNRRLRRRCRDVGGPTPAVLRVLVGLALPGGF